MIIAAATSPEIELARFGPVYGADTADNLIAKELAWKHILQKSSSFYGDEASSASSSTTVADDADGDSGRSDDGVEEGGDVIVEESSVVNDGGTGDEAVLENGLEVYGDGAVGATWKQGESGMICAFKVLGAYWYSISDDAQQALESYEKELVRLKQLTPESSEFKWMMVRDGCFFLQLALRILGDAELIGYTDHNPQFGEGFESTSWLRAMFYVGNQIPCVVISALMKQPFFQNVVEEGMRRGTWKRLQRTKDMVKLVLYRTVVEPEVLVRRGRWWSNWTTSSTTAQIEPPSDILHALHTLLLGHRDTSDPIYSEFYDLEAGRGGVIVDDKMTAEDVCKQGIFIRLPRCGGNGNGIAISNVRFRKNLRVYPRLELPPLRIEAHTEDLLTSLVKYEQNMMWSEREVTSYLRFLRDLAYRYEDFKILESNGIFVFQNDVDPELKRNTVRMIDDILTAHDDSTSTLHFRHIRHTIRRYGALPWALISSIVTLLTLIQTVIGILAYIHDLKH